jgi:hypothetical protein
MWHPGLAPQDTHIMRRNWHTAGRTHAALHVSTRIFVASKTQKELALAAKHTVFVFHSCSRTKLLKDDCHFRISECCGQSTITPCTDDAPRHKHGARVLMENAGTPRRGPAAQYNANVFVICCPREECGSIRLMSNEPNEWHDNKCFSC